MNSLLHVLPDVSFALTPAPPFLALKIFFLNFHSPSRAIYRSFLKDPCDTAHRSKCPQSNHTRIRNNLRPLIRRGDISVSFSQSYKGAPYYIRIEKLKKKPFSGVVPSCRCGRASCELNIYQKGNYTGGREITQHFVDGLKDSRSILSLRAKGKRPAPEVEFVPNKPKPVAEVVDLLE